MGADQLRVIPPDPAAHSNALFALLNLEWQGIEASLRAGQIVHSHYDWNTARIGLLGERLVTHFGVYDIMMRVGVARVRTGNRPAGRL
jgi:hypothetical protein